MWRGVQEIRKMGIEDHSEMASSVLDSVSDAGKRFVSNISDDARAITRGATEVWRENTQPERYAVRRFRGYLTGNRKKASKRSSRKSSR